MKIRIKGNSVRLRLTKSEVATFCESGYFEEQTEFLNGVFSYALQKKETIKTIEADVLENKIIVSISGALVENWAANKKVGFQHLQDLPSGHKLSFLIEKDFVCMDERIEDQSDNYPNPKMT